MNFIRVWCRNPGPVLVALALVAAAASQARADAPGGGRIVPVKSSDTIVVDDNNGRASYSPAQRSRTAARHASRKRAEGIEYAGIGTEEAIRRHHEVVGQLMDNPTRPAECQ